MIATQNSQRNSIIHLIIQNSICAVEVIIKREKMQAEDREKIFANHIYDKVFLCRIPTIQH
jgi:hypothetical protein